MNNYFTLHHLSRYLNLTLAGAVLTSAMSRKKRILELNFTHPNGSLQLVFHAATPPAIFVQDGWSESKTNAASFFEEIWGTALHAVRLHTSDRVVTLDFGGAHALELHVFGPRANAFLLHDGAVVDQFRSCEVSQRGEPFQTGDVAAVEAAIGVKNKVIARNPRFPRPLIDRIAAHMNLSEMDTPELCMFVDHLSEKMLHHPSFRKLGDHSLCLLDATYLPDEAAITYPDVNSLVRAIWIQREIRDRYLSRLRHIQEGLETAEKKINAAIVGLEDQNTTILRSERYEMIGHILMANSHLDPPSTDHVILDDIFHPGEKVNLPVRKGIPFAENAQWMYQKSKDARKAAQANRDRLADTMSKRDKLAEIKASLAPIDGPRSLERWLKANEGHLKAIIPTMQSAEASAKGWRTLMLGNYEIWIGKSAAGNDELLQASHKEDIWMHARHVAGSHLIVRMNKSASFPPSEILEAAASWAAWFSKGKTAGTVPVVYTKRKYVRKPKGSAPGSVRVDREHVCLVGPSKPQHSQSE